MEKPTPIPNTKWLRQAPEYETGDYYFSGRFLVTHTIQSSLTQLEVMHIYVELLALIKEKGGQDYLHVYVHSETKDKLFFIDQLTKTQVESGEFRAEDNYCTLMFNFEY